MRAKDHNCNAILYEKEKEHCTVGIVNENRISEPLYETKEEKKHFYLEPIKGEASGYFWKCFN